MPAPLSNGLSIKLVARTKEPTVNPFDIFQTIMRFFGGMPKFELTFSGKAA